MTKSLKVKTEIHLLAKDRARKAGFRLQSFVETAIRLFDPPPLDALVAKRQRGKQIAG